ncbi:flagellar hook-associated protein FlgK [Thiospirochaeta perfilievii]|uniref:Flagellar hook-associated protein 1 n=1 Tax=Thiospirochaeta perfilievii TaxID=252967 RepID=A0A5C1QEK2_9SPIO|nr:flagellar hook-associated protein FlgK [Thiospirochaeta perfilievii]QEN05818.1 flagellar hook-associated protein FlgK [Thiospirochaeta perfilievii]
MGSTFAGIELGKRSLNANTTALTTIGHNLSNAGTEGYSRQRVKLGTVNPLTDPGLMRPERAGQIGQGVEITSIERIKDNLLENRLISSADEVGFWKAKDTYLYMTEKVYNEVGDSSIRSQLDGFWESWQELSINPELLASKQVVVKRGETLLDSINTRFSGLQEIQTMINDDVKVTVGQVNGLLNNIKDLNEQIVKIEAMGDNPNDLLDKRDLLVKELSQNIEITVDNRDPNEFSVHTKGMHLIQGGIVSGLRAEPNQLNQGFDDIVWDYNGEKVYPKSGKLAGLIELRDVDLRDEINQLDTMTINFVDMVNEVHRESLNPLGETGVDFFTENYFINNISGNYDRNGDGEYDSSFIFRLRGGNKLEPKEQSGLNGVITLPSANGTVDVTYNPNDTVDDIITRINNSGADISASLNRNGQLTFKATPSSNQENPDFVIRSLEDSGEFLVGYAGLLQQSGPDGAYNWEQADSVLQLAAGDSDFSVAPLNNPSGWVTINSRIKADPSVIASGFGNNRDDVNAGDGRAASAIAALRNNDVMIGKYKSFDDYFASTTAEIALKGEQAGISVESHELIMNDLISLQQSVSGVNMDEEMSEMIKFQHGYNAAAKFIAQMDEMMDTIINRMGV